MGSSLFDKQMILNKDYEKLYQHFKKVLIISKVDLLLNKLNYLSYV